MITGSFDAAGEAVISPGSFAGEQRRICDWAVVTFSREIFPAALARFPHEQIGEFRNANRIRPIYLLDTGGMKTVFYLSEIGSSGVSNDIIEASWTTGAENFLVFGSAGALDPARTAGKYVLPTEAYRDEGMSYHYAPPSEYIRIAGSETLAAVFARCRLPYVTGKVWTTDAPYRETRGAVRKRKEEGCIAVEMELAGMQAVCDFHGFRLYDFLVTGDVVDTPAYTPEGLDEANHGTDKFDTALRIMRELRASQERP